MAKAFVVINEQHKLFPEQEELLRKWYGEYTLLKVPANGWTLEEQRRVAKDILGHVEIGTDVVFASPVPVLMGLVVSGREELARTIYGNPMNFGRARVGRVYVFHNDRREKKELPGGRIIQTVASTGWRLVDVSRT